jgi:hypothetical protein
MMRDGMVDAASISLGHLPPTRSRARLLQGRRSFFKKWSDEWARQLPRSTRHAAGEITKKRKMILELPESLLGSENLLFKSYDIRAEAGIRFAVVALFDQREQRPSFLRNAISKSRPFSS